MTEENKDSHAPKLRLSHEPKATTPDTEETPAPKATGEKKSGLRIKRPEAENEAPEQAKRRSETQGNAPTGDIPPASPTVGPLDDRPLDPENPVQGSAGTPKLKTGGHLPPELPVRARDVETREAAGPKAQPGPEIPPKKKACGGLLISIVVLVILFAILGGAGYGLYYVLLNPSGSPEKKTPPEQKVIVESTEAPSGSAISGPIDRARAVVSEVQYPDLVSRTQPEAAPPVDQAEPETSETAPTTTSGRESTTTAQAEPTRATEAESTAAAKPEQAAPTEPKSATRTSSVDPVHTEAISDFLQNAHVGGVRAGDTPRLILNGQSYDQGDLVDSERGLRFIGLRDKRLAFQDAHGIVYLKSF